MSPAIGKGRVLAAPASCWSTIDKFLGVGFADAGFTRIACPALVLESRSQEAARHVLNGYGGIVLANPGTVTLPHAILTN